MIIVDYKAGNIGSILNMFKRIGVTAELSADPDKILQADRLILPGVGAFDNGISRLHESGAFDALNEAVLMKKTPVLGICLGMQLLLEGSEEGNKPGLGWINGFVRRFDSSLSMHPLKIPHMGWNEVRPETQGGLFHNDAKDPENPRYYFVHSYHAVCADDRNIYARTHYGYDFTSAVRHENIYGVQFHPEKSHRFGMNLLKNFVERV